MRLFAAVWPPPAIGRLIGSLERPPLPGVRWTTAEQWHVTLVFFGEVPDDEVSRLADAMGEAARSMPEVPVAAIGDRTRRLGRGVLCAPVSGLDALAARVAESTRRVTRPFMREDPARAPGREVFTGHLTLARSSKGRQIPASLVAQPVLARSAAGSWRVEKICLVASVTAPTGARYRTVVSMPVGSASAV